MRIFMIKGVHDSGKTTLAAGVIRELVSRGHTVGTIKDIHAEDFHMDRPGTDTCQHAEAGAQMVVARGLNETDVLVQRKMSFDELLPLFDQDFLILEGDPGVSCPNLVTGHDEADLDRRCDSMTVGFGGLIAQKLMEYKGKPIYKTTAHLKEITDMIEEKAMELNKKDERKLKLYFDDEEVPMVPFVESFLTSTLLGMMSELKGFEENTKVRIEL